MKFSKFLPKKLKGKFKKSSKTDGNEYTMVPTEDTDATDVKPADNSNFIPHKQSSFIGTNLTYEEESVEPRSMEEELKRLQQ